MNIKKTCRFFLQDPNVDAVLIETPENVRYLSGFTGDSSFIFFSENYSFFITDSRYVEQAKEECPDFTIINHNGELFSTIEYLCKKNNCRKLGFEENHISYLQYCNLKKMLAAVTLVPVSQSSLRQIKNEWEIECIRHACEISVNSLTEIMPLIKIGTTENELRIALESAMLHKGSEKVAFSTIVASGWRSSLPHGVATSKVLSNGEFITFDFGAVYNGYHADITRTFVIGNPSNEQKKMYSSLLEAQTQAKNVIRPNEKISAADACARKILSKSGYDQYFTHSLGHGVGLEIHEEPYLTSKNNSLFTAGMVVTIEPGIYIPKVHGLRIEDTVVVRDFGVETLTKFPKKLYEL